MPRRVKRCTGGTSQGIPSAPEIPGGIGSQENPGEPARRPFCRRAGHERDRGPAAGVPDRQVDLKPAGSAGTESDLV